MKAKEKLSALLKFMVLWSLNHYELLKWKHRIGLMDHYVLEFIWTIMLVGTCFLQYDVTSRIESLKHFPLLTIFGDLKL